MRKQILITATSMALVGLLYSPGLASRDRYESHDRDHDRHEGYEYKYEGRDHRREYEDEDRNHRGGSVHGEQERHERSGDHNRNERYEYGDRNRHVSTARRISEVEAKEIALNSMSRWKVGEAWEKRKKRRTELVVPLIYQDLLVGKIKVHPATGEIMPEEAKHSQGETKISLAQASETVQQALPEMIIGNDIYLGKHGNYWKVPLMLKNIVVEEIKVDSSTGDIYSR